MLDSDRVAPATAAAIDEREACARLAPAMRLFAMRRHRSPSEVDDFVQDALVALVEAIREGRIPTHEAVGPYAIGICRNLLRDGARTRARRERLLAIYGEVLEPSAESGPQLVAFERVRVEDCVSKMTANARAVLKRALAFDESNDEIATALALSEGNVRVTRHRALKFLRECVEQPVSWTTAVVS